MAKCYLCHRGGATVPQDTTRKLWRETSPGNFRSHTVPAVVYAHAECRADIEARNQASRDTIDAGTAASVIEMGRAAGWDEATIKRVLGPLAAHYTPQEAS